MQPSIAGERLGRPWGGVKVYGSIGDAEGQQSHFYRFNLYYRLEAFGEAVRLEAGSYPAIRDDPRGSGNATDGVSLEEDARHTSI